MFENTEVNYDKSPYMVAPINIEEEEKSIQTIEPIQK